MQMVRQQTKCDGIEMMHPLCLAPCFAQTVLGKILCQELTALICYYGKEVVAALKFCSPIIRHGLIVTRLTQLAYHYLRMG